MSYTIEYSIECLPEHISPEGNASAIDDETDAEILAEIYSQLDSGNEWAWCCVRVKATAIDEDGEQIAYGEDYLGGCSYASREDFMACPYYEDMCTIAREQCDNEIARIRKALAQ